MGFKPDPDGRINIDKVTENYELPISKKPVPANIMPIQEEAYGKTDDAIFNVYSILAQNAKTSIKSMQTNASNYLDLRIDSNSDKLYICTNLAGSPAVSNPTGDFRSISIYDLANYQVDKSQLVTNKGLGSLGLTDDDLTSNDEEATFSTIVGAMEDGSYFEDIIYTDNPNFFSCCKNTPSMLIIHRISVARANLLLTTRDSSKIIYRAAHTQNATPGSRFKGWKLLMTEDGGVFKGDISIEKTSGEASVTAKSTTANNSILPYANDTDIGIKSALSGVIFDLLGVSNADNRRGYSDLESLYLSGKRVIKDNGYSLNSNGYIKLELDKGKTIIIQWGNLNTTGNDITTTTLPIAFPNAGLFGLCSIKSSSPLPERNLSSVASLTKTTITHGYDQLGAWWLAIGY